MKKHIAFKNIFKAEFTDNFTDNIGCELNILGTKDSASFKLDLINIV